MDTCCYDISTAAAAAADVARDDGIGRSNEELLLSYKLSKRRWAILAATTTFGFLNGFVNELTAVLGTMVALLGLPLDKFVYLNQAFSCVAPAFALPTAWLVDRHGLRPAALCSLLLVAARNVSRALLFWPQSPHWHQLKILYWAIASCASAQVASIYWCLPLKVAESWFSESERSFAWSCMVAGPLLGMAASSLWSPWAVETTNSSEPLAYANVIALVINLLAVGFGVSRSMPKEAPSARQLAKPATLNRRPLSESLKCLLTNKDVLLQVVALSSFDAGENSIRGLMQDILASSGFKQTFCGQYLAVVAVVSAILQLGSSLLPHKSQDEPDNSSRCKLYASLQWLAFAFYAATLTLKQLHRHYWWLIIVSSLLYTICKCWASPAYNSQMAHLIAGSMSEATVGAAGTVANFMLTNAYTVIFVYFRQPEAKPKHSNYYNSILMLFSLVSSSSFLYLFCFSGQKLGKSADYSSGGSDRRISGDSNQSVRANQSGQHNRPSLQQVAIDDKTKHCRPVATTTAAAGEVATEQPAGK